MKRQNNPQSTNVSLPEVIILEEILSRFPVKSLLRFRCVSKSWRSLIDSEPFIKKQHEISKRDPSFHKQWLIVKNDHMPKQCSLRSLWSEERINPSPLEDQTISSLRPFEIVGCYDGLICIRKHKREGWWFYMWNPSTRISKKLPEIGIRSRRFDFENCGFGWDESSGEYKVFALLFDWDSNSYMGNFYSSKTKSWKTIEYNFSDLPLGIDMVIAEVFVGGKLHWKDTKEDDNSIVSLDLKSEVFGRIELPFDKWTWYSEGLGKIGGCLCVLDHNNVREIRVWVMKESWERLVYLSVDHELLQRPFSASSFTHEGSNGEIYVFDGPTFVVYDPRDNVFRPPKVCCRFRTRHVFVESLVSP